ncbi:exosome non-catalytic core subunit rrp40 [Paraconiothyrium brasiliense]|uniref:Exosome non-catalytic core subunit rrp40 n=1 Tax=Paraconiothyrium brasiliense TaxID=300254 RepID=A0ABR3SAH4_9PLEO
MAVDTMIVLPGDQVPRDALPTPTGKKKQLTLGPGLRHIPPSTVASTIAGALVTDNKKVAAWIESNSGRYLPTAGDLVIATVQTSTAEAFNCTLTPHTPYATLPHLAFEGATKKTRPQLAPNSLVYARVSTATKDFAPELTCVDPSTGKSEGLGPLKGGMVFKISLSMARRMLAGSKGGVVLLEALGEKVGFEIAVGRNGMVVVDGGNVKSTLAIGRAIQEVDEQALGEKAQKKLAERVLKSV